LAQLSSLSPLPFLNVVIDLVKLCSASFSMPMYLNLSADISDLLSNILTEFSPVVLELYDFTLLILQAYTSNLPVDNLSYFLISRLAENGPVLSVSLCQDLLINLTKMSSSAYVNSIFELYESLCDSSVSVLPLEFVLKEALEAKCKESDSVKAVEEFLIENKLSKSYALVARRFGDEKFESFGVKAVCRLGEFLTATAGFMQGLDKAKCNSDQVMLKKLSAFTSARNGFQLIGKL
jgi:hypothetical protein